MSSHYTTEPLPTVTARLDTTAGPIHLSLFAKQTPLACRNFLQHILDGYYDNSVFHRVVPGFVIQGGDPTGTGSGGTSIYEDREFEIDPASGEKIVFGDELHSRLRFNRRGLLGMAKTVEGASETEYGSQFFITLANCQTTLDGKCTLFGRVEGDGIYNVVKIAEGENVEGTDRPVYPFKITGGEVLELPQGEIWQNMKKRERTATVSNGAEKAERRPARRRVKKRGVKALLSFADEGEDADSGLSPATKAGKPKFNTTLIEDENIVTQYQLMRQTKGSISDQHSRVQHSKPLLGKAHRWKSSKSPTSSPEAYPRKSSFHESTTQFPLHDPETPSQSSSPSSSRSRKSITLADTNAQIAALKASMRRDTAPAPEPKVAKSVLDQVIPSTSIKARKRKRPGTNDPVIDSASLKMLNAFKARLDATSDGTGRSASSSSAHANGRAAGRSTAEDVDEEATLCDLHFIADCLSCNRNETAENGADRRDDDENDVSWMSHALSFEKDRLGKDLAWKRKNEEELVVIDPREKEKDIKTRDRGKKGKT